MWLDTEMKSDLRGLNGVEELFGARGMLSARVFTNRLENYLLNGEGVYEVSMCFLECSAL